MLRRDLPGSEWERLVENIDESAWRWEQQPFYASDIASGYPYRWFDGDTRPAEYIRDFCISYVAPLIASGRTRERVRVVDEPLTWFQQWADEQAEMNRDAGEPIWLMPRKRAAFLDLVGDPAVDWWLIDDRFALLMTHNEDGELVRVDYDDELSTLEHCRRVRDTAMAEVAPVR